MEQNDLNHEQMFMLQIHAATNTELVDKYLPMLNERIEALGEEEVIGLNRLSEFYSDMIQAELRLINAQYMLGIITLEQNRIAQKFIARPYIACFSFEKVEELEWRWECLKERAIPTAPPPDLSRMAKVARRRAVLKKAVFRKPDPLQGE